MFNIQKAFSNLCRHKIKTTLNIVICIAAVLFVNVYAANLEKSKKQFLSLQEKIPVTAVITTLDGGWETGLYIREEIYKGIKKSKYVKDARFTLELSGKKKGAQFTVLALDTWPGYEELFRSDQERCIVSSDFAGKQKLKEGDSFTVKLESYEPELENRFSYIVQPLEEVTYEVAGIIRAEEGETTEDAQIMPADIMIPMRTAERCFRDNGREFRVSSGSFYVKNGLELNQFKEEMDDIGLIEVVPKALARVDGNALVVKDQTFIRAAGSLEEGYRVIRLFFPVVCIALALAGFITSYLLMVGRRMEYATMRSLGMTKEACAVTYLTEQATAQLLGGIVGSIVVLFVIKMQVKWICISFGAFFFCFLLGTVIAVWVIGKVSIMSLMAKAD